MLKKRLTKLKKKIAKTVSAKRKEVLLLLIIAFVLCLSIGIYLINKPKPNGDIVLQNTQSESIFTNKNPEFSVEFGKREEPHEQWVRFEAKSSTKNPFKEEEGSVWNKILSAVKPKKNLGIEMSLSGVELSQTESISDEQKAEKLKSVAEVLGTDTIETNTELVDLGRTIWNGEEEDVSRKTIVNRDVAKGVDLTYQIIDGVGLKEEIVIKNLEEYTSECKENVEECAVPLNEFVFDLKVDEGVVLKKGWYSIDNSSAETYYFEDERGNYIAHFLPSFAIDAGGVKTSNVSMDIEEVGEREYKIKVTIDIGWLLSEDRVFPVRIDPSIVHNSKESFDTGKYNQIEYSSTAGGMELLGVDRVGVDSNTVGYWSFDGSAGDRSGNGNNMITTLYGIQYGIQNSTLRFILNQYNGVSNPGEIDITCPNGDTYCYVYDMAGNRLSTPTINSGIAVTDGQTGSGYIMYSPSLSAQGITSTEGSKHTDHFIAVKYTGSTWQYNNNSVWVNFTPTSSNILVAEVTFFTSINKLEIWPKRTEGKINNGYEFDGVNDYVRVDSLSGLSTGAPVLTIEAWIKPGEFDSSGTRQWPLLLGNASGGNIHWTYRKEYTLRTGIWNGVDCEIHVTPGKWSFITMLYDGTNVKCYKDGQFLMNASGSSTPLNLGSTSLTLGKKEVSNEAYFNGSIDEVKISNVARSEEEIYRSYLQSKEKFSGEYVSSVFDSGASVSSANMSGIVSGINTGDGEIPYSTTGLVAQWNFNETSGTTASSGGSCGSACNGTLTNFSDTSGQDKVVSSGWTYNNRRWGGGALMFDGIDDYVTASNSSVGDFGTGDFSVEVWFKGDRPLTDSYPMLVDKEVLSPQRKGYSLNINANSGTSNFFGLAQFEILDDNGIETFCRTTKPVFDSKWHHIVGIKTSSTLSLYLDGNLEEQVENLSLGSLSNSGVFQIGRMQNNSYYYSGMMDAVRIYSRALSSSEVSSNYNSNSVKYFVRGGNSVDSNDGTWSEWNDSTNRESTIKSFDNEYLYDERESGLVSYWTMDEDSGNTVLDARGINNGTATGTTIVDGKYEKGRDFNGAGNYVRIPNSSSLDINGSGSKVSIALWVKLDSMPSSWGTLLYKGSINTGDIYSHRQYGLYVHSSGMLEFNSTSVDNADVSQTYLQTSSSLLSVNNWGYVVGVVDSVSGYLKIYVNGKEVASTSYSTTGIRQGNGDVFLGINNSDGSFVLDGIMDEVRIYNTAMTADKILYDYLEGIQKRGSVSLSSSILSAEESGTINDGLVSYWTMDEDSGNTVLDARGINNGTATGTTIVDGKVNKGRSFNGTSDYITLPSGFSDFTKGFTVSLWAKPTSSANYARFIDFGEVEGNPHTNIIFGRKGTSNDIFLCTDVCLNGGENVIINNEWHLYTVTIDETGMGKVYRDGILLGQGQLVVPANVSRTYNYIGKSNWSADSLYQGYMDEVKIYNIAKTKDEIQRMYNEGLEYRSNRIGSTVNDGLISYWKMDETSGSVVGDSIGTNNGTATGTTIVDGKVNKGRSFNGVDDKVTIAHSSSLDLNVLTVSCWINTTYTGEYFRTIVAKYGSTPIQESWGLGWVGTSTLGFYIRDASGVKNTASAPANSGLDGKWHYLVGVASGSEVSFYMDGVEMGAVSRTSGDIRNTRDVTFGSHVDVYIQGVMDEVKIYNRALSSEEIFDEYAFSKGMYNQRNVGLISYWNMDETSGSVVGDSVGTNNGTATGTTIVDGKVNKGRSFNGTSDYITLPSGFSDFTKGLTVSLWAKPTSNGSYARFIDFGEPSGSGKKHIILARYSTTNDLYLHIGDGTNAPSLRATNAIINNEWHLYTGTVDASGMGRIYRDGVLLKEGQLVVPANVSRAYNYIGKSNWSADSLYQGYMDEVKIYNRALSSEEIFDEYAFSNGTYDQKNVGLISYWNMDETSGTSVKDSIGINHGTATGTTIVGGKVNKGRSFDGVDDYVGISNNIDLKNKSFVVSAWVKRNRNGVQEYFFGQGASTATNLSLHLGFRASSAFVCGFWGNDLETTTTYPELGEWHYYACSYDASTKLRVLYRDGIQVASGTASANYQGVGVSVIGGVSSGVTPSLFMSGSIDEVKIFNRVLSSAEIAEEYVEGVDRHSTSQSSYVNYQIQQSNISNKISLPVYIAGDEPGEYISTTMGESAYANYQPDANTVGLWHLDEIDGNGPFIKDSSGNGNNGMLVGNIHTSNGKIGGAGYFDGTSYVSLGNPPELQITGSETIDMWVYPMSFSYRMNPLDKAHGGEGAITQEPNGTISYYYGTCGGNCTPYEYIVSNLALQSHKWNHIAIVRDLVNMKVSIYVNGVLGNSQTVSMSAAATSQLPVYIGKGYAGPYIGNIDEVRISNIVRTPDEIRQAYEVGLRTHNVEIEFGATLDNSNLISSSSDKSFTINGINKGMMKMGSNINPGEKIIIREQKDTGEYIAQGVVNSINEDTGAVTVTSWDTVSTFPTGGFSTNADVFKWQKEYIPIKGRTLDTQLDQTKLLTVRVDNTYGGRNIWIDNLTADEYVTPSSPETINLGKSYRFFQYKAVLMSTDSDTSPIISQIQLDYTAVPRMDQIMRHGKWFLSGTKQPFWWAK